MILEGKVLVTIAREFEGQPVSARLLRRHRLGTWHCVAGGRLAGAALFSAGWAGRDAAGSLDDLAYAAVD
jgi:hypothetical protein